MGSRITVPVERIENRILLVRGHRVLLDADLAALYSVQTRLLNQAVKRNGERFPPDFMFQLSGKELQDWRSQTVISKSARENGQLGTSSRSPDSPDPACAAAPAN